jgi:two-component system alkaline phosphatase synthesis response regulator PhoP
LKVELEKNDYEVITASDGKKGLEKAHKEKPDLIILDLILPKLDGYVVCSLLKRDKRYSAIPIIVLTARDKEEDLEMGKKVGADAYITKPFKFEILLGKIKELLK